MTDKCKTCSKTLGKNEWDIHTCTPSQISEYMTPEQRIDAALDEICAVSNTMDFDFESEKSLNNMRKAMRKIMVDSYMDGSNYCYKSLVDRKIIK